MVRKTFNVLDRGHVKISRMCYLYINSVLAFDKTLGIYYSKIWLGLWDKTFWPERRVWYFAIYKQSAFPSQPQNKFSCLIFPPILEILLYLFWRLKRRLQNHLKLLNESYRPDPKPANGNYDRVKIMNWARARELNTEMAFSRHEDIYTWICQRRN